MPGTVVDSGIRGINKIDKCSCPRRSWILVKRHEHKLNAINLGFDLKNCEAIGRNAFKRITVASVL